MLQSSSLKKLTGSILPKAGIFYLSVLLIIGTFSPTLAAPTKLLNYQARITDPSGESVSDGSYSIVFRIYNVASGGSALWTETNEVSLEDGILDVRLGNSTPINLDFNTGTYYLGVTIEDDSELSPRRPIGAAPFALNSSLLDGRPIGTGPNDVLALDNSSNLNLPNNLNTDGNANVDGNTTIGGNATIDGSLTSGLVNTSFVTLGTSSIGGTNGRIRFTGTDFEGFFGGVWHSLTQTGADLQGSEGQIAFFDDTDTLVGDDNFFFDQANSRLGIGTNNPTESLDIVGNGKFSGNVRWYSGTGFFGELDHSITANRVYTFPNKSGTVAMLDDISVVNDHGSLTGLGDDDHAQYALLAGRSSGQILYGGTASGADLTLRSTTNGTKGSVFVVDDGGTVIIGTAGNATLSVPGAGLSSLQIGASTTATMLGAIAVGTSAVATEIEATAIGFVSLASGHHSTALGARAEATALHSIALGDRSRADEANSLVIGNDFEGGYDTRNVYVGYGRVSSFAPGSSVTFNATGGLGTDIDGADLQLAGGRPTGSGNGGEIRFLTAPSGASSSSLQALITRWIVQEDGHIIPGANDTYDIGSDSARVRDLYLGAGTLHVGTGTADEGTVSYDTASNELEININGTNIALVQSDGDFIVGQLGSGNISVPGSGMNSEQFGAGSSASFNDSIAVGNSANTTGIDSVAVGNAASAGMSGTAIGRGASSASEGVALGRNAMAGSSQAVALGRGANAAFNQSIAIGYDSETTGMDSVAIGTQSTAAANSVALGFQATAASGQFVVGSDNMNISNVYFGGGSTEASPQTNVIINATGGSGTNIAATNLILAGGRGTGTGAGGDLLFQTASPGLTGSTLNPLATRFTIDDVGNVVVGTSALTASATDGFLYTTSMPGTPTGIPTNHTGRVPMTFNTATNTLYFYNGGWQAIGGGGGGITGTGTAGQVTYWTGASAVSGNDDLFWDSGDLQLGIGNTTPRYKLDVATSTSSTQIRFGSSGDDNGGFLTSWTENNAYLAGGAVWESGDWIAKSDSAAILGSGSVGIGSTRLRFYVNDGLTAGNTFTPTERMTIAETGNVGINDTTPDDFRLQVGGDIGPTTDDTFDLGSDSLRWDSLFIGGSSTCCAGTIHIGSSLSDEATFDFNTDDDRLEVGLDGTVRMVITDQGNVGIGTDDPIGKLAIQNANTSTGLTGLDEISQDSSFAGVLLRSVYEADTNMQGVMWTNSAADNYQNPIAGMWAQQNDGGSELRFGTSNDFDTGVNNFGLVIGNNGNIAVGSSTDTGATFNVWNGGANFGSINDLATSANNAGIRVQAGADNDTYKPGVFWSLDKDDLDDFSHSRPVGGTWLYQDGTSTNMIFGVSDDPTVGITNFVMIDEDGDLGIGYDTPSAFYPLDVKTDGTAIGLANSSGDYLVTINPDQSVGGGTFDVIAGNSDADQLWVGRDTLENPTSAINGAGDAEFTTVTETSDQRLKKNISPVLSGLDVVNALNPVTYDFKKGKKDQSGFIAQEVQKILPGLVTKKPDGYFGLNYSGIIPYIVKAAQELNVQVISIKNDISSLKVSIADLKNDIKDLKGDVAGIKDRLDSIESKPTANESVIGGNIKLDEGAVEYKVELDKDLGKSDYSSSIAPSWNTNFWITDKNTSWFNVHFGVAAPKDSSFDFIIVK